MEGTLVGGKTEPISNPWLKVFALWVWPDQKSFWNVPSIWDCHWFINDYGGAFILVVRTWQCERDASPVQRFASIQLDLSKLKLNLMSLSSFGISFDYNIISIWLSQKHGLIWFSWSLHPSGEKLSVYRPRQGFVCPQQGFANIVRAKL